MRRYFVVMLCLLCVGGEVMVGIATWASELPDSRNEERTLLLQISEELALLSELSRYGRTVLDVAAPQQFDYHALEVDLAVMRQAVLQYLATPSRLPPHLPFPEGVHVHE